MFLHSNQALPVQRIRCHRIYRGRLDRKEQKTSLTVESEMVKFFFTFDMDSYAISRIDLPVMRSHGWQVRLRRQGRQFSKFFSDGKYGGTGRALRIARAYRDELLAKLPEPERAGAEGKLTRRNVSGVVGVSRIVIKSGTSRYEFWQATWSSGPGVRKRMKFSVRRYGEKRAFELACVARKRGERK